MALAQPAPIDVADLWEPLHDALLELLRTLTPAEWATPDTCGAWSVHDVALHLLGGDVGILSRQRDGYRLAGPPGDRWDDLVAFVNALNDRWIVATRRISPPLLCTLLDITGRETTAWFRSRDPNALGAPVGWAGPAPAPVWLDLAREYTERWHHQQQIRDAVGKPGMTAPRFVAPALDAFARALPHTYRDVAAPNGTTLALHIDGEAGGAWTLRRDDAGWTLWIGVTAAAAAVHLPQDIAWRLFTRGISSSEAARAATITGDPPLGEGILHMVSVIA